MATARPAGTPSVAIAVQVGIRRRLAARHVVGADDDLERVGDAGRSQHGFDFRAHRARRDAEPVAGAEPRDGRGRAGKQHGAAGQPRLVGARLGGDERIFIAGLEDELGVDGERADEVPVVEAEVTIEIGGLVERPAAEAEDVLKRPEVQALGVGEHAVEVEDDGAGRGHLAAARRSPARIAAVSRFSRGGTGHSYDGLYTQYGWYARLKSRS